MELEDGKLNEIYSLLEEAKEAKSRFISNDVFPKVDKLVAFAKAAYEDYKKIEKYVLDIIENNKEILLGLDDLNIDNNYSGSLRMFRPNAPVAQVWSKGLHVNFIYKPSGKLKVDERNGGLYVKASPEEIDITKIWMYTSDREDQERYKLSMWESLVDGVVVPASEQRTRDSMIQLYCKALTTKELAVWMLEALKKHIASKKEAYNKKSKAIIDANFKLNSVLARCDYVKIEI